MCRHCWGPHSKEVKQNISRDFIQTLSYRSAQTCTVWLQERSQLQTSELRAFLRQWWARRYNFWKRIKVSGGEHTRWILSLAITASSSGSQGSDGTSCKYFLHLGSASDVLWKIYKWGPLLRRMLQDLCCCFNPSAFLPPPPHPQYIHYALCTVVLLRLR